jgi:hypothetical protein
MTELILASSTTAVCTAHTYHRPVNVTIEFHHVIPQAWQRVWTPATPPPDAVPGRGDSGPLWDARKVPLCPTGHRNVHACIVALMHGTEPPRQGGYELECAKLALSRFVAAGGSLDFLRENKQWGEA